jgi:Ca2+-binding RTX toxin-like protein
MMPVWKYKIVSNASQGTEFLYETTSDLPNFSFTATQMRYSGADQLVSLFQGAGIRANASDEITRGTITSITMKLAGQIALTATGLNVAAKSVFDFMAASNGEGLASLTFAGKDKIFGTNLGEDLYGFGGNDTIFGGGGIDQISGDSGSDLLYGGIGADQIRGFSGADRIYGGAGADYIAGYEGADKIFGGTGNDTLYGDDGNSLLSGGLGHDSLLAGIGATDRILFNTAPGAANSDVIVNFEANVDMVLLDNDVFVAIGPVGGLAAGRFVVGAAAADAGDRIIYDDATGNLWYDKDGTGGSAARLIATMAGGLALTAADFAIIN